MLGDDGNQIGAHSALLAASKRLAASLRSEDGSEDGRTLHSALERLFSGIHFGMDDWGNWRLNFI
jgi:hypothetical protein